MSIFAKIKSTKKAADEHKASEAAKKAAEASTAAVPVAPYRHVPRHAAQDALAGTPGVADRAAIREANQARAMYAQNSWHSTSSPSLARSYSSDGIANLPAANAASMPAAGVSMSRCSSRAGTRVPRIDRRAHPGYSSYQFGTQPTSPQRSRRGSGSRNSQAKSPLSSEPITPLDSGASSSVSSSASSSSISSTRSYTDPIERSAPLSQRLEAPNVILEKPAPRTPLYVSKSTSLPKPWEVKTIAKENSKTVAVVAEIQTPAPTAQPVKRSRFIGFRGKQQAVAAC